MAPTRLRLGLELLHDSVRWGVVLRHAARQNQVPSTDSATASYTVLDLSAAGRLGSGQTSWFLRLRNASNQLGFNASAIQTVRGLAPLPGRALAAGMQWRF